ASLRRVPQPRFLGARADAPTCEPARGLPAQGDARVRERPAHRLRRRDDAGARRPARRSTGRPRSFPRALRFGTGGLPGSDTVDAAAVVSFRTDREDAAVNGFWIVGAAINVIALAVVLAWAVRTWKQTDDARRRRSHESRGVEPDS